MIWQHVVIHPPVSPINSSDNYAEPSTPGQQQLKLVLDHDCKHQGCRDEACRHCRHSSTRCSSTLRPVYVSGQLLLACCGGKPQARLVPTLGGDAGLLLPPGWQLQVQLLDSKAYEHLSQHGLQLTAQQLASCLVRGSPLLQSGAEQRSSSVTLPLQAGTACLAGLRCIKPEKATDDTKHSGKTTLCRLLLTVTATDAATHTSPEVLPLVSGPFKVVTARSKGAAKADVPLPNEAVSRLRGVGKDMAASLKALRVTADDGKQLGPVDTVVQFHALQHWVDRGGAPRLQQLLQDTGIKPAAYKEAAKHVQLTAFPDFRPRVWWWQGQARGLLCSWDQATTAPGVPLSWVQQQQQQGLPYLLVPLGMASYAAGLQPALQLAQQEWRAAGHGSWEVFWSDDADPLAQRWAQHGVLFDLPALPLGILNAMAAAAAGTIPPADEAAAPAAAAAGASMQVPAAATLLPVQQQQQLSVELQPAQQQEQQELTAAALLPATQQQQLQQEIEALEQKRQDALKRKQQLLLQLAPQPLHGMAGPVTPAVSGLSAPLLPASETAEHPLVQAGLLAQTSDASTLMDQQLLQQPQKRQKLLQQQQEPAPELGAAEDCRVDVVVRSAQADTVAGPPATEAVMVGPEDADDAAMMEDMALALLLEVELSLPSWVQVEDRALSLDRQPSWLKAAGELAGEL